MVDVVQNHALVTCMGSEVPVHELLFVQDLDHVKVEVGFMAYCIGLKLMFDTAERKLILPRCTRAKLPAPNVRWNSKSDKR